MEVLYSMEIYEIALAAGLILLSIFLVVVVLLQESKSAGLSGAIAGGADTFFGKNKGRTMEAKLAKITKLVAALFFVLTLATCVVIAFLR